MNKVFFCLFFYCLFLPLFCMEMDPELSDKSYIQVNLPIRPPNDYKEFLPLNGLEPCTGKTYRDYIQEKSKASSVVLLARVVTDQGVTYWDVEGLNRYRCDSLYPRITLAGLRQEDPNTKLPILRVVRYFYLHGINDERLQYIGSDLHFRSPGPLSDLLQTFFDDMIHPREDKKQSALSFDPVLWRKALTTLCRARCFNVGSVVSQDFDQAYERYQAMADQSVNKWAQTIATFYCAEMHFLGEGRPLNYETAHNYYQKVLDKTESSWAQAHAHFRLGGLYFNGWGVTRNFTAAKHFFESAAQQNSHRMVQVYAFYLLAYMHHKLECGCFDELTAEYYYSLVFNQNVGASVRLNAWIKLRKLRSNREWREAKYNFLSNNDDRTNC